MVFPILTAFLLAGAGLDHGAVRRHYADGELDRALGILEAFVRSGDRCSREDSLFIYRHLGAIHSRRKETREQGRACFLKLLRMDPGARIQDIGADAAVLEAFQDAREELAAAAASEEKRVVARFETLLPEGGRRPSAWSGTGRTWVWVGAAGLGVAGAVIGYHYLVDGEVPEDKVISLTD